MICKYCGMETTSGNGICKACQYKLRVSPNEEGTDIFSSSGMADRAKSESNVSIKEYATPITPEPKESFVDYAPKTAKKRKLRKGFVATVVIVLLLICGVSLYFAGAFKSVTAKINDHFEEENYSAAYTVFENEFTAEGGVALNKMLELRLDSLYEDYRQNLREYSAVKEEFDTIEKMEITNLKKKVNQIGMQLSDMKESKDAFKKGEKYYSKKNYALSILEYEKVIKDDVDYDNARAKAAQAKSNYRNTVLGDAAELMAEGDYESAVKLLKSALDILEDDKLIEKRIKEYGESESSKSRQEIIDEADKHAFNENYAGAITYIMTTLENNEEYESDEVIMNSLEDYRSLYTDQFSEKMDEYIEDGRYDEAAELLEEADRVIPGSKTAEEKEQLLEGKMPEYLHELIPISKKKWSWGKGESTDSFGGEHSAAANYVLLSADSKVSYDLEGKYENFKCYVAAGKNIDQSVKCKVEVTATVGGEYLYREWEISADTEPQDITMITKDCASLTISISGEGAKVLLYDARLTKN